MKKLTMIFLIVGLFLSCGSLPAQQLSQEAKPITIGKVIQVSSKILPEKRQIYIALPEGYDTLSRKLPVIYVLDAETRFGIAQSILAYFKTTTRIPQAILIGIANTSREARSRDYLPKSYGGEAHNFLDFMEKELFPFVEKTFPVNTTRYLVGHSHGGVFTVHTLLNRPDLCQGYVAIDPSLKYIYQEGDPGLQQDLHEKKLYLASSDGAYGYMEDVIADMQADFAIFKNHLYQTREKTQLKFKIDHIHDDHGNAYIQGLSRGLRYMFNWRFE